MYTIRKDKPLNPVTQAVLVSLQEVAKDFEVEYFVIGATARDILMAHVFGIDPWRGTRDVDFAVAVENWIQFDSIKQALVDSGNFEVSPDQSHRLYYRRSQFDTGYPLDLIPFGAVERPGHLIAWPPDMEVLMSVAGYAEALASAVRVDIGSGVVAHVVSIPALTALKILAWNDRGLLSGRDAEDFNFLLRNYHHVVEDRLFDEAYSLLEAAGYDLKLAGASLLGYDSNVILGVSTREAVLAVLRDARKRDRLVIHMDRSIAADSAATQGFVVQFEHGLTLSHL